MGVADQIIEAVKNKAIRHFFLVGGCDGAKPGRDYYTKFVEQIPDVCVVLTLACCTLQFLVISESNQTTVERSKRDRVDTN